MTPIPPRPRTPSMRHPANTSWGDSSAMATPHCGEGAATPGAARAITAATRPDEQTASTRRAPCATVTGMTQLTHVTQVTDADFDAVVLESDRPVLVDFWAAWCGPCRVMHPILAELAADRDDIRVVKLDTEEHQEVAARYGVLAMPTFLLFKGGEPVLQLVGSRARKRRAAGGAGAARRGNEGG